METAAFQAAEEIGIARGFSVARSSFRVLQFNWNQAVRLGV